MVAPKLVARDVSWLSFNSRVLQEAMDESNSLQERIQFLGIFSNNLDEFFRVRVATLQRILQVDKKARSETKKTILQIEKKLADQQKQFQNIWNKIVKELEQNKVFFKSASQLTNEQQLFVLQYFDEEVESNVTPLMLDSKKHFPSLREKSLYLAVVLSNKKNKKFSNYSLIEVPVRLTPRFVLLPNSKGEHHVMLLEDVIRFCLPRIFSMFPVNKFSSHIVKFTRDAELDIDNDVTTSMIQKLEKGIQQRKQARPVRFVYDKLIDKKLLQFLIKKMGITNSDAIIAGGSIHNFRHFINFPSQVFVKKEEWQKPFHHPLLQVVKTVTDTILQKDILLQFPYHSFDAVIDMLREAAMHPFVTEIKLTAYRLAGQSKIINALINAVKNGKKVTVLIELKARFDEEANLLWKKRLEEDGIEVLISPPNLKVHAKICLIKKVEKGKTIHYGFISTGNVNEKTAKVYSDVCLLTSNRFLMADANKIFNYLRGNLQNTKALLACKKFWVSPVSMRKKIVNSIQAEINNHLQKKESGIILKVNSLTDAVIIDKLMEAVNIGVSVQLIVRSIFCIPTVLKNKTNFKAISLVGKNLEHARIFYFTNAGKKNVFISSADCMGRNLDHRVEVACPIEDEFIKIEIEDFLNMQLADNTKARIWDTDLQNNYVSNAGLKKVNAQEEVYQYLKNKV